MPALHRSALTARASGPACASFEPPARTRFFARWGSENAPERVVRAPGRIVESDRPRNDGLALQNRGGAQRMTRRATEAASYRRLTKRPA
jgi:hypothetical protein